MFPLLPRPLPAPLRTAPPGGGQADDVRGGGQGSVPCVPGGDGAADCGAAECRGASGTFGGAVGPGREGAAAPGGDGARPQAAEAAWRNRGHAAGERHLHHQPRRTDARRGLSSNHVGALCASSANRHGGHRLCTVQSAAALPPPPPPPPPAPPPPAAANERRRLRQGRLLASQSQRT